MGVLLGGLCSPGLPGSASRLLLFLLEAFNSVETNGNKLFVLQAKENPLSSINLCFIQLILSPAIAFLVSRFPGHRWLVPANSNSVPNCWLSVASYRLQTGM